MMRPLPDTSREEWEDGYWEADSDVFLWRLLSGPVLRSGDVEWGERWPTWKNHFMRDEELEALDRAWGAAMRSHYRPVIERLIPDFPWDLLRDER